MPSHLYIVMDLGTSFFKAAVADVRSMRLLQVIRRPTPDPVPGQPALFHELNCTKVMQTVRELLEELVQSTEHYHGILFCGQMGGLVLTDQNGQPLANAISWLDRRLVGDHPKEDGTWFDAFTRAVGDGAAERMGNEFRPGLALPLLYWLAHHQQLPEKECIPVTLPDFVTANLCGQTPVMEWTTATGSLEIATRDFPVDWFRFPVIHPVLLPSMRLPRLVRYQSVIGGCKVKGKPLPVFAAVGDHQCSLAGTQLAAGELSLNISTGSQVSIMTNKATPGDYQLRPYFDGQWLKTITNIPAGRSLNALMKLLTELARDDFNEDAAWTEFFAQAEAVASSDLQMNLAFFPGAVPGPGSLSNLREDNLTVGHIARAALEQMAVQYEEFARRLCPDRSWQRIAFSGGLAQKSELLRKLILNRLGEKHRVADSTEDALQGLMILGRVISRLAGSVEESIQQVREISSRSD